MNSWLVPSYASGLYHYCSYIDIIVLLVRSLDLRSPSFLRTASRAWEVMLYGNPITSSSCRSACRSRALMDWGISGLMWLHLTYIGFRRRAWIIPDPFDPDPRLKPWTYSCISPNQNPWSSVETGYPGLTRIEKRVLEPHIIHKCISCWDPRPMCSR